jgi:hypothetical protein
MILPDRDAMNFNKFPSSKEEIVLNLKRMRKNKTE